MLVRALVAASMLFLAATITGGVLRAQTPQPGSSVATPSATSEVSPEATPVAATTTPLPNVSAPHSLVGYVVEDVDGNGVRSAGDRPSKTLTQLALTSEGRVSGEGTKTVPLLTDDGGRFEFDDLPTGDYELTVWWSPGFVGVQGTLVPEEALTDPTLVPPRFSDMLRLRVTVTPDGAEAYSYSTRASVGGATQIRDVQNAPALPPGDLVILGRPNTEGLLPYPVNTGEGGGPVPIGKVSFAHVSMPSSGEAGDSNGLSRGWLLAGIGAVLFLGTTAFLRLRRPKTR